MTTSRVSPTLLLCYICFLRALQQNRSQARLLYLLNKILPFQSCLSANFLGLGVISDVGLILWRSLLIASICSPRWQRNSVFSPDPNHFSRCWSTIPSHIRNACSQQQYPSQYQSEGNQNPKRGPEFPRHCALNWKIKLHKIRIKKLRKSEQQWFEWLITYYRAT